MIRPGSIEFRKHLSRVLPLQGGEQKAQYIRRIARHFGISTSRMTVLYYDSRKDNARFTTSEYSKIFSSNPAAKSPNTEDLRTALNDLRIKLEEKENSIKTLEREFNGTREKYRKIGALLASL